MHDEFDIMVTKSLLEMAKKPIDIRPSGWGVQVNHYMKKNKNGQMTHTGHRYIEVPKHYYQPDMEQYLTRIGREACRILSKLGTLWEIESMDEDGYAQCTFSGHLPTKIIIKSLLNVTLEELHHYLLGFFLYTNTHWVPYNHLRKLYMGNLNEYFNDLFVNNVARRGIRVDFSGDRYVTRRKVFGRKVTGVIFAGNSDAGTIGTDGECV